MPDGTPWSKISIVTPSLNQGKYIEETIRSVLLQGYPDFEYIIIDGGSTDGTCDIIRKYSKWLAYWVSEPDRGQSHALNKGFAKATGEIFAYINSDDFYEPNAFGTIAPLFKDSGGPLLLAGECLIFCENGIKRIFKPWWPASLSHYVKKTYSSTFGQPASFWSRDIHGKTGGFNENLSFCFDREFFLRMGLAGVSPMMLQKPLACYREHIDTKSLLHGTRFHEESISILNQHFAACGLTEKQRRRIQKNLETEMHYILVFRKWSEMGRLAALKDYASMIAANPRSLADRKVLGQGRRLLTFRSIDVPELR